MSQSIPFATMDSVNDGGPAFPKVPDDIRNGSAGMSLRDWFAGQALGSIPLRSWDHTGAEVIRLWAVAAYALADAMLAERAKATAS